MRGNGRPSRRDLRSVRFGALMLVAAAMTFASSAAGQQTGTDSDRYATGAEGGLANGKITQGFSEQGACVIVAQDLCVTVDQPACMNLGGTFIGIGTACCDDGSAGDCTRCCFSDGLACESILVDECLSQGGAPAWDFVANDYLLFASCADGCDPVAGCCLADGSCVPAQERYCFDVLGGEYLGYALDVVDPCLTADCLGACCLPPSGGVEQACLDGVTKEDCEALGGSFLGHDSLCPMPGEPCSLVRECATLTEPIFTKQTLTKTLGVAQFPNDPLRELIRATVELDGRVVHHYFGINYSQEPQIADIDLLESHEIQSIVGDPSTTSLLLIELGDEMREGQTLFQGETYFYGSPDLFPYTPYSAEYTGADLAQFIGNGDVEAVLGVQGGFDPPQLSKFGLISLSHVAEIEFCVTYEFEQLGACCFCDGTCIDGLSQEECAQAEHPSVPAYDMTGLWYAGLTCDELTVMQCDDTVGYCCDLGTQNCMGELTQRCCEEIMSGIWYPTEEECIENCEECIPGEPNDCGGKGSLVIISKVDIRWDAFGNLLQDTFIQLSNDYPGDVFVQMYFVNGDDPLPMMGEERAHPGWNNVDNMIMLTGNQTRAWSAVDGDFGISPWTVLDPGDPPGRPADDGSGERMLRGFIYAWAVTVDNVELSWNHLSGGATLVRYDIPSAWEYEACTFASLEPFNTVHGSPGVLNLDGYEYGAPPDLLLMNFQEVGSEAWSSPSIETESWTSITLHAASADLRLDNTTGPISTTAEFFVWNENEQKLGGDFHCFTCWDQRYLDQLTVAQNFGNLGTDQGFALIDGRSSVLCNEPGMFTQAAALLGLRAHHLVFSPPAGGGEGDGTTGPPNGRSTSGGPLIGCGVECAKIWYDVLVEPPPESEGAFGPADRFVKEWINAHPAVR